MSKIGNPLKVEIYEPLEIPVPGYAPAPKETEVGPSTPVRAPEKEPEKVAA